MHARMHPSASLRAAADHQQTVDMTCGAAVELERCSDRPLCRSTVRVAVAAAPRALRRRPGRGSIGRTGKQGRWAGHERTWEPGRGRRFEGDAVRGAHARRRRPPAAGVPACPALQRRPETVNEPSRPWRVRGRARGPLILLQRLRVHQVNDWVRGCGLPVRGTAATTHGAGAGGLVPWPPRSRFRRALLPACRMRRATNAQWLAQGHAQFASSARSATYETRPRSPAGPLLCSDPAETGYPETQRLESNGELFVYVRVCRWTRWKCRSRDTSFKSTQSCIRRGGRTRSCCHGLGAEFESQDPLLVATLHWRGICVVDMLNSITTACIQKSTVSIFF